MNTSIFAMPPRDRPVWIEIQKNNLIHNFSAIKKASGDKKVIAVLKANAYGHGAVVVARILQEQEVDYIGVVSVGEAKELRSAGIETPILILNYVPPSAFDEALSHNLTLTMMDIDGLNELDKVAEKRKVYANIHIHIDTGMHREGVPAAEFKAFYDHAQDLEHIGIEGLYMHFATSDEKDLSFAHEQMLRFKQCVEDIQRTTGSIPPVIHIANSAAILQIPESMDAYPWITAVRPGIILYGYSPSHECRLLLPLLPVLSLKGIVSSIRTIHKGESVGYGRTFIADKDYRIALVNIGYADGLPRPLSNTWDFLINGKKMKIAGRISMDQTSLIVDEGVQIGDPVTIIGTQGEETISVDMIADAAGTINHDIFSRIHASRLPRIIV